MITFVESVRPSDTQIEQMWDQNPKGGGGAAWRAVVDGKEVVQWRKGLDKKEMVAINKELPIPYVLHFRQPSHDTSDSLLACHPFQIDAGATSGFEGTFEGWVLFHNGYWAEWRRKLEALAIAAFGVPGFEGLPSGAWSDTRGLAWAAHYLKFGFLEMVNEKVFCFGPGEFDVEMFGGPWLAVKGQGSDKSFVVSNRTWEKSVFGHVHDRRNDASREATAKLLEAAKDTTTGKSGGTFQEKTFPSAIDGVAGKEGSEGNLQQSVQESTKRPLTGDAAQTSPLAWVDGQRRPCSKCSKSTGAGNIILGRWFCFQCWSNHPLRDTHTQDEPVARLINTAMWVGTCERCRVGSSGMKTVIGDMWLCHTCYETSGKPKIYYARERQEKAS